MLRRLQPSEFQNVLVIATFAVTLAVFAFFFIRALRMQKDKADHLSQLPLQDDSEPTSPS
jgi:preprotein translocase subunit SecY